MNIFKRKNTKHEDNTLKINRSKQISFAPKWEDNIKKVDKIPNISILRRLFHPGPIFALLIITTIAILSFYLHFVYFNYSYYSIIFSICYAYLAGQLLMNFFSACYYGPGYLPKGWEPIPSKNKNKLQKCPRCEGYKAPRSHHCRKCNACCMKMDHHCPYINNCLGFSNHKFFLLFMIYAIVGCFYSVCISSVYLYDAYIILTADDDFIFDQHSFTHLSFSNVACAISNFGLALAVDIALSILLFVQMKAVITNKTQIENFICAKMFHSETLNENEKQSYPYDLGWKENLKQVFCHGLKPKGNGIWYDTIKGTDNFTLSVIQKMLKAEKASCSRKYRIITSQLESYGIIKCCINYGIRVAWSKPCFNDEPFLPVNVGEVYLVNRGNKEWIYGERIVSMSNSSTETKGWFPRRLAKVVLEEVSSNSEDESTNTE